MADEAGGNHRRRRRIRDVHDVESLIRRKGGTVVDHVGKVPHVLHTVRAGEIRGRNADRRRRADAVGRVDDAQHPPMPAAK